MVSARERHRSIVGGGPAVDEKGNREEPLNPASATQRGRICRGYKEKESIDMCVLNDLDRFHLVGDVIDRVPGCRTTLIEHKQYIREHGEDLPEIRNWNRKG